MLGAPFPTIANLALRGPARVLCVALTLLVPAAAAALPALAQAAPEGIQKIQHIVVIQQENRSFDSYFGTYPGANGIPKEVCLPDPLHGGCIPPSHTTADKNRGGPHGTEASIGDINGGKMDGFVAQVEQRLKCGSFEPACKPCPEKESGKCIDVMGYHDAREIPNYWTYAKDFVLQDNMFASTASYSLPEHLVALSGWSAVCPAGGVEPLTCVASLNPLHDGIETMGSYPWTDITYQLHKANVSWRYYVFQGHEPDCASNEAVTCKPGRLQAKTWGIWNPLPAFNTVKEDGQVANVQSLTHFYRALSAKRECALPNVAWVTPNSSVSEHPPSLISKGQTYVTTLVNAIMRSNCWGSTAIFVSWDDWGGFYDHVVPPQPIVEGGEAMGYGLRVPGLVISPYAREGYVDHQLLSHDAYLKFIQDVFLSGARLNPATDGRPDGRKVVREALPQLGGLQSDFNFEQAPRAPVLLSAHPEPGPPSEPPH